MDRLTRISCVHVLWLLVRRFTSIGHSITGHHRHCRLHRFLRPMGACASVQQPLQQPHDANSAPTALVPVALEHAASPSSTAAQSDAPMTAADSPLSAAGTSVCAAVPAAHPFGCAMSPPQIAALHPSKGSVGRALPRAQECLWRDEILADPLSFMRAHTARWHDILAAEAVPQRHRVAVWTAALRLDEMKWPCSYSEYLQQSSPCDDQIGRDIHRTFADHDFFRHLPIQKCVGRILHSWSLLCPRIGYVQGHNYLAALLLWVCVDEELAWRMLCAFLAHPERGLAPLFEAGLANLVAQCGRLDALVAASLPRLGAHLRSRNLEALMYGTPLYLTAFAHHLPLAPALPVWDCILLTQIDPQATHPLAAASPTAAAVVAPPKRNAVAPLPLPSAESAGLAGPSLSLSLLPSPLSHAITLLALSLLETQQADLLKLRSMEHVFQAIQQLGPLRKEKTRRRVWKVAFAKAAAMNKLQQHAQANRDGALAVAVTVQATPASTAF